MPFGTMSGFRVIGVRQGRPRASVSGMWGGHSVALVAATEREAQGSVAL